MKIAVFGVWHVHAPDYTRKAQAHGEVIGFYEKNDALAEEYAKEFGLHRFATPEELLASDAEGVIVCSASCDHAEDLVRIANAKKHIFTEKVLTLTDEEAARVREAVEKNGVTLTISLFQKYLGSRIAVKEVVESGELGKINYVRFRNCHSGSNLNGVNITKDNFEDYFTLTTEAEFVGNDVKITYSIKPKDSSYANNSNSSSTISVEIGAVVSPLSFYYGEPSYNEKYTVTLSKNQNYTASGSFSFYYYSFTETVYWMADVTYCSGTIGK